MNTKSLFHFSLIAMLFATISVSCKKNYEGPPEASDPNIQATITIKDLKARHTVSGVYDVINDSAIISGVVIANDKSGNFYKEMYIRDATGAIAVQLAGTLYTNYPVGKRVFIKCKGLCLADYRNLIQLGIKSVSNGVPTLESIPTPIIPNYVIGGSLGNDASPKSIVASDLNNPTGVTTMQNPLVGDLVKLEGYEFFIGNTKRSYGDTSAAKSVLGGQINIKNCSSPGSLIVMTSGYADFAGKAPQAGNGSITAVFTVYGSTTQLIIRDTTDVKFSGARCFLFEEDFQAYPTTGNAPLAITGWKNIQETGDVPYTMAAFGSSVFPKISAFSSAVLPTTNITSWLISPAISLPSGISPKYTFTCARRYPAGTFKALISFDYNGINTPSTATWTEFITVPAGGSASFTPFDLFGPFDLSAYTGKNIYLAFKYEAPAGTSKTAVGTYEPDDMKISKN